MYTAKTYILTIDTVLYCVVLYCIAFLLHPTSTIHMHGAWLWVVAFAPNPIHV